MKWLGCISRGWPSELMCVWNTAEVQFDNDGVVGEGDQGRLSMARLRA